MVPDNKEEEHNDEKQVLLDVDRSLNAYPQGQCRSWHETTLPIVHVLILNFGNPGLDEASKKQKQADLNELIVEVLRRNKSLHYYQVISRTSHNN
jgi:hypothetical protein